MSYRWSDNLWKPSCDEDGTWSAVQCKGEQLHGRCFCYNTNGSRIFGWSWWHSAGNMTCACSRRRDTLKNQGRENVTLHCSEDGNYEKLQCDSGLCWCVDPQTGEPTERAYPESMMTHLSCYDKDKIGSQYLRLCESMHIARLEVIDKLERHGRLYAHIDTVNCDGDGSYAYYSLNGSIVYCLWKNGMRIDLYQTPLSSILTVNCNCARDSYIYRQANLTFSLQCQSNGNYKPEQTSNGYPFCVDSDGYATTTLGSFGETLICKE
ncbi:uncharacterized protein LOC107268836 isoform X2 [Cephus cinctus]|nr:uncharacterized protein LOC107268836 isoform X2 [Cephus cinctus]